MDLQQKKSGGDTVLGDDTSFVGKIESRGTLRIDGRVEGEVVAQDAVFVGPSGIVKADLTAAAVSISGQIDGNVVATRKIELLPTAVVKGDIKTLAGALTVEAGAKIDGRVSMSDEKPAVAGVKPPMPEPARARPVEPPKPPLAPGQQLAALKS